MNDDIVEWLRSLNIWDNKFNESISQTGFLSFPDETEIKETIPKLDNDDCILFSKLLHDCYDGIPMQTLGISKEECLTVLNEGDCSSAKLVRMRLARYDANEHLLKATKIAFNQDVQYLAGYLTSI